MLEYIDSSNIHQYTEFNCFIIVFLYYDSIVYNHHQLNQDKFGKNKHNHIYNNIVTIQQAFEYFNNGDCDVVLSL